MLLAISRPTITLLNTPNPVIEAIVNLMPDYSGGKRLHDLYVNKLESALPGNYSQLFGTGPAFRSIFYPNWRPDPLLQFTADTGLSDSWWSDFSIAVLCQAIAEMGSNIRGQMLTGKINNDVSSFNSTLRGQSHRAYARVLAATYNPLVSLLRQLNMATAKQEFYDSLLNNVVNRQLWYQAGMWHSPDWEMFNQYAKYIALGASDAEVDALIGKLKDAGLPVPPQVDQGAWRTYAEEFRDKSNLDVDDVRQATSGPISMSTYMPSFGGGMPSTMPNGNCYEFTANSQPGTIYRQVPGSCCFTGDTQVLDGSGNPVDLRQIKSGDTVLTRDGTATVAYVSVPLRSARRLHCLQGGGPIFTEAHPFLNGVTTDLVECPPALLALKPKKLSWSVPTLSEDGIGTLKAGSTLLSRVPGPDKPTLPITVTGIEYITDEPDDKYLYDLRLATSSGTRQEYWAGREDRFYLVSPEFPVLDQAGASAVTVVAIMEGLLSSNGLNKVDWDSGLIDVLNSFGIGIFHNALMQSLASTPSFDVPPPPFPIYERINRLYDNLGEVSKEMASAVASLFDGLLASGGQWLSSLLNLGWRTSLLLGGDVLAVTVFDLDLTPNNSISASTLIELDIKVIGQNQSDADVRIWNRCGRGNTHFHHFFDQVIYLNMTGEDRPTDMVFSAKVQGSPIPTLFAEVIGETGDFTHKLVSTTLKNPAGEIVGTICFDMRRLGRDSASQELGYSGLWTNDAQAAYANALGVGMVEPILWKLSELTSGGNKLT